jgi:sugar transferase (PEP-CTERM/EpsH1 system associated)
VAADAAVVRKPYRPTNRALLALTLVRILFLAHRIPYPPNKGDKIRAFHILQHLCTRHDVTLATLIDDSTDLAVVPALRKHVKALVHERIDQAGRRLWALRGLLLGGSITVRHFYTPRLQVAIDGLLEANEFDAVFCSCSPMAEYVFRSRHFAGRLARLVKLMDFIDVDSYKWRQYADRSPAWSAWVYRHEARTLGAYERRICREFDRVLLVSEQEASYFPDALDAGKLQAVGNGVDLEFFQPHPERSADDGPVLVFTGMMDYWPNVEGMRWFLHNVYPRVREALPSIKLLVVGSRPTSEVRGWVKHGGVTVTGYVPDVRDYLGKAAVCIAPLRVARGIQNKVLEAMAMGKAVVSTPEAFEGIRAVPGDDLVLAADATTFAANVIALLNDPVEAKRVGDNARRCVERNYSWAANLAVLDSLMVPPSAAAHP